MTEIAKEKGYEGPLPMMADAIVAAEGNLSEAIRRIGTSATVFYYWMQWLHVNRKVIVTVEILPRNLRKAGRKKRIAEQKNDEA